MNIQPNSEPQYFVSFEVRVLMNTEKFKMMCGGDFKIKCVKFSHYSLQKALEILQNPQANGIVGESSEIIDFKVEHISPTKANTQKDLLIIDGMKDIRNNERLSIPILLEVIKKITG